MITLHLVRPNEDRPVCGADWRPTGQAFWYGGWGRKGRRLCGYCVQWRLRRVAAIKRGEV